MDLKSATCGNPVKEMVAENGDDDAAFQNGGPEVAETPNSAPIRNSVSPGLTDDMTDERVMSILSNILPSSGFPHIKQVESFSYEKRSNEEPKNAKGKRKGGKTREKTTVIRAENLEGYIGRNSIESILHELGVHESDGGKGKKKAKKVKKASSGKENGAPAKSSAEKAVKKDGGTKNKPMSSEPSPAPAQCSPPDSEQLQSPPSEVDQEVAIALDTAEDEEFVSAPEDNTTDEPAESPEEAKPTPETPTAMVLKLASGKQVNIPIALPQERIKSERELAIDRMWEKFEAGPPPTYVTK
uniref:Phosphoprotein n=1 Tax=Steinernema glaseri TaxID=37863 RepID=A0A1I8AUP2_9BILA